MSYPIRALTLASALLSAALPANAQQTIVDLTVGDVGLGVGDSRRVTGLRLNYADREMERVIGVNLTLLPGRSTGHVSGLAVSAFGAHAEAIDGVAIAPFLQGRRRLAGVNAAVFMLAGTNASAHSEPQAPRTGEIVGIAVGGAMIAERRLRGIAIAPLVATNARARGGEGIDGIVIGLMSYTVRRRGIAVNGLHTGSNDMSGVVLSGLSSMSSGNVTGISVGGLASRVDGRFRGVSAAGLVSDLRNGMTGISIGGLAAGTRGEATGLMIGGLSARAATTRGIVISPVRAAANNANGLTVGGVFAQGTTSLDGVTAGLIVLSPTIRGVATAATIGGHNLTGIFIAPVGTSVDGKGTLRGVAISGINAIHGAQRGLTIGILNSASELKGVQIGVINVARDNPGWRRVMPLINW
jgi:hypothetical protein